MKIFAVALLALASTLASTNATSCETLENNKKTAVALLDEVFNKKDVTAVDRYISPTKYWQHNPLVPDGPQSLKNFAAAFTNETKAEFGVVVASGDLVWVNGRYTGLPGIPTSVAMDVFRFENGKIVEHWDVLQKEVPAAQTVSGHPMFPIQGQVSTKTPTSCGGECDDLTSQEESNKKIGVAFYDEVVNKKDVTAVDRYVSPTFVQHNPLVPDGPQALKDFAAVFTNETKVEFGAVVASGDLVWINGRYSGLPGIPTSVAVDVFRFENGKIVEHWDILQAEVPACKTASLRPMFPIQSHVAG